MDASAPQLQVDLQPVPLPTHVLPSTALMRAPQNPPSSMDILRGVKYRDRVLRAIRFAQTNHRSRSNQFWDQLARAYDDSDQYLCQLRIKRDFAKAIAADNDAVAGGGDLRTILTGMAAQLARIETKVTAVEDKITAVQGDITTMQDDIKMLRDDVAVIKWRQSADETARINSSLYDGQVVPYEVIPFPDGSMPGNADPPLPALHTAEAVERLTVGQLKEYIQHYFPNENHGAATEVTNRRRLTAFIGCSDVDTDL